MFQSFTGSSRRPRQVNLSGRKSSTNSTLGQSNGPHQALKNAQREKANRQQQRLDLSAARHIQRLWRGYSSRKKCRLQWRHQWDATRQAHPIFESSSHALASLSLLSSFFSCQDPLDLRRLLDFARSYSKVAVTDQVLREDDQWRLAYRRLEVMCLSALHTTATADSWCTLPEIDQLLLLLSIAVGRDNESPHPLSSSYYATMTTLFRTSHRSDALFAAILSPLRQPILAIYLPFVELFLSEPLSSIDLDTIVKALDPLSLLKAARKVSSHSQLLSDPRRCLWLLGQFIYLQHAAGLRRESPEPDHIDLSEPLVFIMVNLLATVASHFAIDTKFVDMENTEYDQSILRNTLRAPLNTFLGHQLRKLSSRESLRYLLDQPPRGTPASKAKLVADYALTLFQAYPAKADDIRIQLCLARSPSVSKNDPGPISAIAYFWIGTKSSKLFLDISQNTRAAVRLLAPFVSLSENESHRPCGISDEWRVVLMFLDLYSFVLRLIDDEEFLGQSTAGQDSFRSNPLSINDLAQLASFLKNLGFALYYLAEEIAQASHATPVPSSRLTTSSSINSSQNEPQTGEEEMLQDVAVIRLPSTTLDYVRRLTTSLAKAIYERDSRRHFLPKDHWLMTSWFDMPMFIKDVMAEEVRHRNPEFDDEDDNHDDNAYDTSTNAISNHRASRQPVFSRAAIRHRQQLRSLTPRWQILQHMPFLLPFETRVEIFRECVYLDQLERRQGNVDPDTWRSVMLSVSRGDMSRLQPHHAKVRRKHEFEDAFNQLYTLGAALKEPLQITFVDEFDITEAGIDGGGVTKEFLTVATAEAFTPEMGLFQTNSKHLLYPDPTTIDLVRETCAEAGYSETSSVYREETADLLKRYEFLGRIIGKCLYEGILVDIAFAGFFLVNWAVKDIEAGAQQHRPSINELRDFDEELYQGLLYLKNYTGNVEDLGLTFVVTHEIKLGDGSTKVIERPIVPHGGDMAVTKSNVLIYIDRMAHYRLATQSERQTAHFLRGLTSMIDPRWLSMFNQAELQTLIGGTASSIDVSDLRRNTHYGGVYVIGDDGLEHPSIRHFWAVMTGLPDADRRKVLKFVTSTPRAPLLGFASLNPKFSIRDSGADQGRFPTTSTCVNLLKLPRYDSEETLRKKLLYAVNANAGFDLS